MEDDPIIRCAMLILSMISFFIFVGLTVAILA